MSAHLSAIDLLKLGDEDRKKPFLNLYWPYLIGATFGVGTGVMINFGTRRPVFSGNLLYNNNKVDCTFLRVFTNGNRLHNKQLFIQCLRYSKTHLWCGRMVCPIKLRSE